MSAAQEIGPNMRLLLIDISGIFRAYWHSSGGEEMNATSEKTLAKVAALRARWPLAVACCDSSPYLRRLALLPTYKGNRDKPSETMIDQFRRVKARIEQSGVPLWKCANEEADDVIASAVARAKAEGMPVTIASSDKDLLQLVDDDADVDVYSPLKDKLYRKLDVVTEWGVSPDMLLDSLALQGDTSDNVPGLPGVGPKTAAKLLAEFGTFDGVFANADKITKPKLADAVATNGDAARLARKLIALRSDIPVPWEQLFATKQETPIIMNEITDAEFDPISAPVAPPAATATPLPVAPAPTVQIAPTATPLIADEPRAQSTALAVVPQDWALALEPSSLGGAQKLAIGLFNSQMYTRFPTPEAIWAVIIRGREMGMGALTALDSFHFFEGKPAMHAHLIIERAKSHPDCEYFRFVGGDDAYAEYETKNRKNAAPTKLRYTIEQAIQAGLAPETPRTKPTPGEKDRRGQWEKRPSEQLRKTCGVQLARIEYPGAAMGLSCVSELGGDE